MSEAAGGVLMMPKAGPRRLWRRQMGTFVGRLSRANGCICWGEADGPSCRHQPAARTQGGREGRGEAVCSADWSQKGLSSHAGLAGSLCPRILHLCLLGDVGRTWLLGQRSPHPAPFALSNIFYPLVGSFFWCHFFFWIVQIYFIHIQGNFFFIKIFWHDFIGNFTH